MCTAKPGAAGITPPNHQHSKMHLTSSPLRFLLIHLDKQRLWLQVCILYIQHSVFIQKFTPMQVMLDENASKSKSLEMYSM